MVELTFNRRCPMHRWRTGKYGNAVDADGPIGRRKSLVTGSDDPGLPSKFDACRDEPCQRWSRQRHLEAGIRRSAVHVCRAFDPVFTLKSYLCELEVSTYTRLTGSGFQGRSGILIRNERHGDMEAAGHRGTRTILAHRRGGSRCATLYTRDAVVLL